MLLSLSIKKQQNFNLRISFLIIIVIGLKSFFAFSEINANLDLAQLTKELQRFPRVELLQGQFHQSKFLTEFNIPLSTEGEFEVYQKSEPTKESSDPVGPYTLNWKVKKPEPSEICIDHQSIIMKEQDLKGNKKTKKIRLQEIAATTPSILFLLNLFKLDPKELYLNFTISKKSNFDFSLTPRNLEKNPFQQIHIKFNTQGFIEKTEITEKNKDILKIEFSKLKSIKKWNPSMQAPVCS